ncbi:hypothetical protein XNC1_0010 [Xenorhabdus nematophila ATCC 19061]|uniref:Uncharacterized protein n=1 Tax=Xenorhabdus nematophila (strain ATCC 19061 / DSM 3370 / CCUG 14189 / LMG 1036 / NCIMB 9965 / AN6) TaxID=406817 RepID=D3VG13_XENNA|nr:hypothetical protein D3790_15525 [Xenorhabdus nematophila]CBJ88103.1 hypothetical protein XNC1_0010 [Xenorhabdus nematophila ATCC 19061]CEE94912.1 hypothetical protein XNA1_4840015 [Xenorhabdus nematophila str. Anatoliense]CEF33598.1 hypothetical protein XNW1_4810027 [Xenorhabdus nematophila str. Websteri]CEK21017.1 hypothetical protein XNC2_0010 [Xenorhabdus nematophila AN6/1]
MLYYNNIARGFMKSGIHPYYRTVVFHDTSTGSYFKVGSTIHTENHYVGRERVPLYHD